MNLWDLIVLALLAAMAASTVYFILTRRRGPKSPDARRIKDEAIAQWKDKFSSVLADDGDNKRTHEFSAMPAGDLATWSQKSFAEVENIGQWLTGYKWLLSPDDQSRVAAHMAKARQIETALKNGLEALRGGAKASLLPDAQTSNKVAVELLLENNFAEIGKVKSILSDRLAAISRNG